MALQNDPLRTLCNRIFIVAAVALLVPVMGCSGSAFENVGSSTSDSNDRAGNPAPSSDQSSGGVVNEPVSVGGAYLVCAQDPSLASAQQTAIGCALYGNAQKVNLPEVASVNARTLNAGGGEIPSTVTPLANHNLWHWVVRVPSNAALANARIQLTIIFEGAAASTYEGVISGTVPTTGTPFMIGATLLQTDQSMPIVDGRPLSFTVPAAVVKSTVNAAPVTADIRVRSDVTTVICRYVGAGKVMALESCDNRSLAGAVLNGNRIDLTIVNNGGSGQGITLTFIGAAWQ